MTESQILYFIGAYIVIGVLTGLIISFCKLLNSFKNGHTFEETLTKNIIEDVEDDYYLNGPTYTTIQDYTISCVVKNIFIWPLSIIYYLYSGFINLLIILSRIGK